MQRFLFALLVCTLAPGVSAHGDAQTKRGDVKRSAEETPFGRPGNAKSVARTIRVEMSDRMRFSPANLAIRRGDTVRFEIINTGKVLHEMVLGTEKELREHAELMKKFPNMEHDEPYMAHIDPGKRGSMIWQFSKTGNFLYGCLVPGHFEAGMIGRIEVKP